ncbi:unnamed protein product [Ceutorhynchus assimilis]|uniref:RIB43A-like with coiled-coils protein 2 n=1 Tax=Ceutorhynchus assimilis TaxID=467358 RepID=A0A9N9MDU5_9CUCU|nr:unnamed protein product [Ceutorhynchus assimilis]
MLKFQLMTEKDRREAAYIERRRIQEEERKKRILNPRARLIGVDKNALESQIEEKKRLEEEKRRTDQIFEEHLRKADELAVALEHKQKEEQKKFQQKINTFRKNYQKPEDRREFDLNDPDGKKKELPCRMNDDDPRLGPSSAQKFEGEDLVSERRLKVQKEQTKSWLEQQFMEKQQAEEERQMAEDAYKAAVIARDIRCIELEKIEKECRRKLEEANTQYNLALAEEKCKSNLSKTHQTTNDNTAEIYNTLTSDLLTENPDVSQSNMGPGKILAYLYKGMSDEERSQIRNEQRLQAEEARKKRESDVRMQREFDDYINGTQKSIYLMDQELERKQRDIRKKIAQENLKMAEEHRSRKNYFDKIVYTNRPTEDYFQQFNKTSR